MCEYVCVYVCERECVCARSSNLWPVPHKIRKTEEEEEVCVCVCVCACECEMWCLSGGLFGSGGLGLNSHKMHSFNPQQPLPSHIHPHTPIGQPLRHPVF